MGAKRSGSQLPAGGSPPRGGWVLTIWTQSSFADTNFTVVAAFYFITDFTVSIYRQNTRCYTRCQVPLGTLPVLPESSAWGQWRSAVPKPRVYLAVFLKPLGERLWHSGLVAAESSGSTVHNT